MSDETKTDQASSDSLAEKMRTVASEHPVAAAVGVAATIAGAVVVRAIRKRTKASDEEETIFHLRHQDDAWVLQIEGEPKPQATYATKEEGLTAARELAHRSAPCELVIYRTDGTQQDRHSYES